MIKMKVIDAENMVLGRLAQHVAKQALLGHKVAVVNTEKAVITGNKRTILEKYKHRRERGAPRTGPFFPRLPERIFKRTVRGMLPYKKPRGREAFKNIMCYHGIPNDLQDKKIEKIDEFDIKHKNVSYTNVLTISKELGAKV